MWQDFHASLLVSPASNKDSLMTKDVAQYFKNVTGTLMPSDQEYSY